MRHVCKTTIGSYRPVGWQAVINRDNVVVPVVGFGGRYRAGRIDNRRRPLPALTHPDSALVFAILRMHAHHLQALRVEVSAVHMRDRVK